MEQIFHPIKDYLQQGGSWVDSIKIRFPSIEDYNQQKIAIPEYLIERIDEILKENPFCVLFGNRNSGKSWLIFLYYFNKQPKEETPAFSRIMQQLLSPDSVLTENIFHYGEVSSSFNAITAWDEIYTGFKNGKHSANYYYVLDDCHFNPEETLKFFETAYHHIKEDKNLQQHLKIIFSTRKIATKILKDDPIDNFLYSYADQTKCLIYTHLSDKSFLHFNNIIKSYIIYAKIPVDFQTRQPEIIQLYESIGYDLLHLKVILAAWQRSPTKKISEIGFNEIYESFWALDGEIRLNDNQRREPLLQLSLLCQFDSIYIFENHVMIQNYSEIYRQLKREGLISYIQHENDHYYNIHSSFAWLIIRTIQTFDHSRRSDKHIIENETVSVFKEYITLQSPPNLPSILFALISEIKNDNDDFAKKVFAAYFFDDTIWSNIKTTVLSLDLLSFCKFSGIFSAKFDIVTDKLKYHLLREKENELVREYLKTQRDVIRDTFLNQNLRSFYKNIRCLSHLSNPSNFLSFLTVQNFQDLFRTGNFSLIYRINQYFIEKRITGLRIKLLNALNLMETSYLLNNDKRSLRRVYGFIRDEQNILQKKSENPEIHDLNLQFIDKCLLYIVKKENFNLLVINNDMVLSDPSDDHYYSPFHIISAMIDWLSLSKKETTAELLKNNVLDFNWSTHLYNEEYSSDVIEKKNGTFQYLITKYFTNSERRKLLFSNYTIDNFSKVYQNYHIKINSI